ncbi:MAG TPA: N-acetylmuramoyl-L-alanine amidase, partial [Kofleriaceae bacterium]|nr:N-acetylmuramoyl-L-alanine amidase [Kofleriaceae bacterium]
DPAHAARAAGGLMGTIILAGVEHAVDAPVVTWHDSGLDATAEHCVQIPDHYDGTDILALDPRAQNRTPRRYNYRPGMRALRRADQVRGAQALIHQFVIHHDGLFSARQCFHVLHNERGISCHFILDDDGTIYQTLDLALLAFQAVGCNVHGIGIELCNRGDARKFPHAYPGNQRPPTTIRIHGEIIYSYTFTRAQLDSMRQLALDLRRILPGIPMEYPQKAPDQQLWEPLERAPEFRGYLGHYHVTDNKWDPGPFDFRDLHRKVTRAVYLPLSAGPTTTAAAALPEEGNALAEAADRLHGTAEQDSPGGWFPLGPFGAHRLWHGGVHLRAPAGTPVRAICPGTLVAARLNSAPAIGSTSFVLLRHRLAVDDKTLDFCSLYFHLADARAAAEPVRPPWARGQADAWSALAGGAAVGLDLPVLGGEIIGAVGEAGPEGARTGQLHFEILAAGAVLAELAPDAFTLIDGGAGRFSDSAEVNQPIDGDGDGDLSADELRSYFGWGLGRRFRTAAVRSLSEWTAQPDWTAELTPRAAEFKEGAPSGPGAGPAVGQGSLDIAALVAAQVAPAVWWSDDIADRAGLPRDGRVVHYHPVSFARVLQEVLHVEKKQMPAVALGAYSLGAAARSPRLLADDFADAAGRAAFSDTEIDDYCAHQLPLEQMVLGFEGAPECWPYGKR